MIKKYILVSVLLIWGCIQAKPDLEHFNLIQSGINASIMEDYNTSLALFDSLIQLSPNHPAGYFFKAAAYQSRMMDFETNTGKKEFYQNIEKAITNAEAFVKNGNDTATGYFFMGAARSYNSYQLARDKKYFSAIRIASQSIDELKKCVVMDSTWYDAYLGIGSYEYWGSYLTRKFSWLPFFSDKRNNGIEKLVTVSKSGTFTRWAALSNLAWIYIEEENFTKAIETAKTGLKNFPDSRFFLWPLGDALFKAGEYNNAIDAYKRLLESVTRESMNNHYNEIVLNLKLGKCYKALEQNNLAFNYLTTAVQLEADEYINDRAKKQQEKAAKLLGEINHAFRE